MHSSSKPPIVAANSGQQGSQRRFPWVRVGLLAMLPLFGVVGAFGVAPSTSVTTVEVRSVVEEVTLDPVTVESAPASTRYWREERIVRGDTLPALLSRMGIEDADASRFLSRLPTQRKSFRLQPGRSVVAEFDGEGKLIEMVLRGDPSATVVKRQNSGFIVEDEPLNLERRVLLRSGIIESSLFAAMDEVGVPEPVANDFADVFSSEIDLHRDLRRGDRFALAYEMLYADGEFVRAGRILTAQFVNQGKSRQAIYFEDPASGRGDYFSPSGRSLRRAFLRSPLEFSRVTSGFSGSRLHPVLQIWRAHKGIDYGAPVGTRVRATADGSISFVGYQNGYGKVVVVRHSGGFSTLYGHLSAFAKQVVPGAKVGQGETIGFVGMTGMSTGPHLHYEFHVNGVHVDPMRYTPDQGVEITADVRRTFLNTVAERSSLLDILSDIHVASQD